MFQINWPLEKNFYFGLSESLRAKTRYESSSSRPVVSWAPALAGSDHSFKFYWFTQLSQFMVYSKMNLKYVYIYTLLFLNLFLYRSLQSSLYFTFVSYQLSLLIFYQRRQWHPTPVLLPGKSHGRRSLVGCSPWGRKESGTTVRLHFHFSLSYIGEGNGNPLQCSFLENPKDGGA